MNILIAEDEKTLGDLLVRALPRMIPGSKVVVLEDVIEVVTTMQSLAEGEKVNWPTVVISDYHLINGTGNTILQLAARLFPDAKLILMSGGADVQNVEGVRATVSRPVTFLQKPFDLTKLVGTILA